MAQLPSPPLFPTTEMRKKQKQEDELEQHPFGSLPEGPLVEIPSRVPYMSLCRFKCVSKPWLALCSDPDIRKRSPQTLSGFIHLSTNGVKFRNLSGRGPPMVDPCLPFLCESYGFVFPVHYCGGLVLCRCWKPCHSKNNEYNLVVCNPATEKWIELPPCTIDSPKAADEYLGFDPAVPSHFVVFVMNPWEFTEVAIYSSDTGPWTTMQNGWIDEHFPIGHLDCVFLNGTMHMMTTDSSVATLDTEGKVWKEIDFPDEMLEDENYATSSIGQSQGCLYAWCIDTSNVCQLSVWALYDYGSAQWILKHTVNILELFGRHSREEDESYTVVAIHPHRNLIFLSDGKEQTISYDMDNREVRMIGTSDEFLDVQPFIPCFAEWPSDGH